MKLQDVQPVILPVTAGIAGTVDVRPPSTGMAALALVMHTATAPTPLRLDGRGQQQGLDMAEQGPSREQPHRRVARCPWWRLNFSS